MSGEAVTEQQDVCMREQIPDLIVEGGPMAVTVTARILGLATAVVRRHITTLLSSGQVIEYGPGVIGKRGRGRPTRHYVATKNAHTNLPEGYSELALKALGCLEQVGGGKAVEGFATARSREVEKHYAPIIQAAGSDPRIRAFALTDALTQDDYTTTVRDIGGGQIAVQLCQGHCPIQQVAGDFPAPCEAETGAFVRLLDVHVQRLATSAGGDHVCTTHIPVGAPMIHPAVRTALHKQHAHRLIERLALI